LKNSFALGLKDRETADVLVLPFLEGPHEAVNLSSVQLSFKRVLDSGDFKGKAGEILFVYPEGEKEGRFLLLGLGKEASVSAETLRRSYAQAMRAIQNVKAKSANFVISAIERLSRAEILQGTAEGILLSNYAFNRLRGNSLKDASPLLEKAGWLGLDKKEQAKLDTWQVIIGSVHFARDLVNGNADDVTAAMLAETARLLEKDSSKLKTVIYDKKWLEKQKMGLILAVNRASQNDPCLIEVSYKGNPRSKEHIVLVGKGVSYDTGGLSLKPTDGMLAMKCDMAGAAAVLGAIRTAALLGLKINVTVVVPAVENCIDAASYKLGDVYRSYSGKTVEINNTDAEGRLILADALAYAVKNLAPTSIIDLATLTGAVVVALGEQVAGICATDDVLAQDLLDASIKTSELLCRLPLYTDYKEAFKSDIADMTNSGGREAGSIKGALFLHEFVGSAVWAHLDIAGTAYWSKAKYYNPTKATGYGVRLLVEFLTKRAEK